MSAPNLRDAKCCGTCVNFYEEAYNGPFGTCQRFHEPKSFDKYGSRLTVTGYEVCDDHAPGSERGPGFDLIVRYTPEVQEALKRWPGWVDPLASGGEEKT